MQTGRERILKQRTAHNGYLQLHLDRSGKRKTFKVHRLVCEAFHVNPENKPCVNHIDENKANNIASNLEWCTVAENNTHGTRTARTSKTVGQYTTDGVLVKVWQSLHEVERPLGSTKEVSVKSHEENKKQHTATCGNILMKYNKLYFYHFNKKQTKDITNKDNNKMKKIKKIFSCFSTSSYSRWSSFYNKNSKCSVNSL